jgi:Carbohydrate family 9 binding domain-like
VTRYEILALVVAAILTTTGSAAGQQNEAPARPAATAPVVGPAVPAAPSAPEVITRDSAGSATVRAVAATGPIRLDGRLDEAHYTTVLPFSDFVQIDPRNGQPATQRTEAWLSFDDNNVYVSVRCFESNPERMVANELRRDNIIIYNNNDAVTFIFDTFYSRRDGTLFVVTPIGGRFDGQYTNERQYNQDFNPIWDVRTGRFDGGWTFEAAIPFKTLRYPQEGPQVWGFNMMRNNRWKNELSSGDAAAAGQGRQRRHPIVARGDAGRHRRAGTLQEHRDQAVCHRRRRDRPDGVAREVERRGSRCRARREVRPLARHDRRHHLQP